MPEAARRTRRRGVLVAVGAAAALPLACRAAPAEPPPSPAPPARVLRVGVSGDYAPFARATDAGKLEGLDVALAERFGRDQGMALETVRFAWPALTDDLRAGRFDLAFSGVTVRPERSLAGRFSVSTAEGGALALVRDRARFARPGALDAPGVRIAVNAGGHLERVARRVFPRAEIRPEPRNDDVPRRLAEGLADAAVTDTFEAPSWLARVPGAAPLGPFTRDRKAALVRPDAPELSEALDAWLLAREADGTLPALRRAWLGEETARAPQAAPLRALLAAVDERLALMPYVADAKRRAGRALLDAAQEQRVREAAVRTTSEAARRAGVASPPEDSVRALFATLIDLATRVQERSLAAGGPGVAGPHEAPDLDTELRPAIARVSERIAFLLVRWDGSETDAVLRDATRDALRAGFVQPDDADALAAALARYARSSARATSPASTGSATEMP
jgi:cyclohexadienyl dehydratase